MTIVTNSNVPSKMNLAQIEAKAHALRAEYAQGLAKAFGKWVARQWAVVTHRSARHAA
jgi:hypothetical protein